MGAYIVNVHGVCQFFAFRFVVMELLETETNYVHDLGLVIEVGMGVFGFVFRVCLVCMYRRV